MIELMKRDKKSSSNSINLVLIESAGKAFRRDENYFYSVQEGQLKSFLNDFMKGYSYLVENCSDYIRRDSIAYGNEGYSQYSVDFLIICASLGINTNRRICGFFIYKKGQEKT